MAKVGDEIKRRREASGISQNQLAMRAGIAQSTLSAIEKTTKSPNAETLIAIASALGCTVAELMGEVHAGTGVSFVLLPEEREIIIAYRKATADTRKAARAVLGVQEQAQQARAISG